MTTISRYIVERSPDQVPIAFQGIVRLCESKGITRITLVVSSKRNWDTTIVAQFLGLTAAKTLMKGQGVTLNKSVTMMLESVKTFRDTAGLGLLVGVHVPLKEMSKLDESWNAQAIVFLPWNVPDAQEWRATWLPETFGSGNGNPPSDGGLSDHVQEVLLELTRSINLSSGLSHPLDKKHAERAIEKLRADGHPFDPAELRRWAQRNGWSSKAAAGLEVIARK